MQKMLSRLVVVAFILSGLAACGGGGGGGPSGTSSKAFVLDAGNHAVGSMIDPNPSPGTFAIDRIISGPSTGLGTGTFSPVTTLPSLALDAAGDRIYVATQNSVLQWENAGLVNGNVPRTRVITSQVTRGTTVFAVNFFNLFIDTINNRLYAAEPTGDVHVYNGARTLSGLVPPTRTITPDLGTASIVTTFGVAVDVARDMLYVGVDPGGSRIIVFDDQESLNTTGGPPRAPDRTLLVTDVRSFYLDTVNDRLYTAQSFGIIRVFDGASALNGAVVANRTFTLGNTQKYIFVDTANDRLYGVSENVVFIVPNASTADGPGVMGTFLQVQTTGSSFSAVAVKP
jgi:hypothetical protein